MPNSEGFQENGDKHLTARCANRAQHPKLYPSLYYAERHNVVNEKHADDKREKTEGLQIQGKAAAKLLQGVAIALYRPENNAGR